MWKSGVSGELRYFAFAPGSMARPPKATTRPRAIVDREHHPVAEAVVGDRDPLAVDEQPRLDHLIDDDALSRQRVAQGEALGRGEAQRKAALRRGTEAPIGQIAPRLCPDRLLEIGLEQTLRHCQHVEKACAFLLLFGFGVALARHRHAGHGGQPLDRLREAETLGLHHEGEDVAVLARREVEEEALSGR